MEKFCFEEKHKTTNKQTKREKLLRGECKGQLYWWPASAMAAPLWSKDKCWKFGRLSMAVQQQGMNKSIKTSPQRQTLREWHQQPCTILQNTCKGGHRSQNNRRSPWWVITNMHYFLFLYSHIVGFRRLVYKTDSPFFLFKNKNNERTQTTFYTTFPPWIARYCAKLTSSNTDSRKMRNGG